jgi:hypothetical protein
MNKLTLTLAAGATAAMLAAPALAETVYVYRDSSPTYVVSEPRVVIPSQPGERVYVDRPYYAYDSYYVWDPATRRYEPRFRYRDVDGTGRSYPVTAAEASRLYGYPYGYDGNPGYLYWNGRGVALARDPGLTQDSNPDDYSSGKYNPRK